MIDEDILQGHRVSAEHRSVAPPERPIGNVANGERLFTQQCTSCHRVAGRGGRLGPDLTRIGVQRSHAALTREIRTPSEWIGAGVRNRHDRHARTASACAARRKRKTCSASR
jgi:mono/diheme cytochrome c family protein